MSDRKLSLFFRITYDEGSRRSIRNGQWPPGICSSLWKALVQLDMVTFFPDGGQLSGSLGRRWNTGLPEEQLKWGKKRNRSIRTELVICVKSEN